MTTDGIDPVPAPLSLQATLSRQRVAYGLMDLRVPGAETGLNQVLTNRVSMWRKAVRRLGGDQYESTDIGKRPPCTTGRARVVRFVLACA
jgi:hypothetical protein